MSPINFEYQHDEIDGLLDDLTKPFYILRMARAAATNMYSSPQMKKSGKTRAQNAKDEIKIVIYNYIQKRDGLQ